jgi:hypothetical protein
VKFQGWWSGLIEYSCEVHLLSVGRLRGTVVGSHGLRIIESCEAVSAGLGPGGYFTGVRLQNRPGGNRIAHRLDEGLRHCAELSEYSRHDGALSDLDPDHISRRSVDFGSLKRARGWVTVPANPALRSGPSGAPARSLSVAVTQSCGHEAGSSQDDQVRPVDARCVLVARRVGRIDIRSAVVPAHDQRHRRSNSNNQ